MKSIIKKTVIFLMLFTLIVPIQKFLTNSKTEDWFKERMTYLPGSSDIKPFLFGNAATYANFLWIRTMLYFGGQYETEKDYFWLTSMIDMVTKLNPYFYPAYEFAGVMLPHESNDVDAARIILDRGVTYLADKRFIIPFYMAWIYHEKMNDPETAAHYMKIASSHPEAPPFYSAFTATLLNRSDQKNIALAFLESAYYSSQNPAVKETIVDKLESFGVDVSGFWERTKLNQ